MTLELIWLAYVALGAVVGIMAGLLGVGGGGIMVPILTALFLAQGVPLEHLAHLALGTSMAAIIPASTASLLSHRRHGAVRWETVRYLTPGILVGTFLATFIAALLPTRGLAIFFACFMILMSLQMLANIKPKPTRNLPGAVGLGGAGLGIGGISALVAIGGGSLTVPFLTWCNVKLPQAIGTSAAVGLPIALAGALGYVINGWGTPGLPGAALGFVYLPALLLMAPFSMLMAPVGARLAHRLPVTILKRIFAVMMMGLALQMVYTVFTA
ncbi:MULTISPECIES: sulfite exporter TauE/SafE family protein [Halomonadaceae]|uniref:Probable membrane transporter protein n=1 Tax=Billgrantia aerodenitrificans TaxID=2733483 RepID=A0ABS9AR68_9GAMM|nr:MULTISPECIES: sulfite exporter TauE/SafE family protein [Halomonas]MCE8024342.1 sulfite exporter TauE/SafE family protein [Halomonas aerodenitrificans]